MVNSILTFDPRSNKFEVHVKCTYCEEIKVFEVDNDSKAGYMKWLKGEGLIQDLMPDVLPENRELLISGICSDCWKAVF